MHPNSFSSFSLTNICSIWFFAFSSTFVSMTTTLISCSHTMRQKSSAVSFKGPWVAMYCFSYLKKKKKQRNKQTNKQIKSTYTPST